MNNKIDDNKVKPEEVNPINFKRNLLSPETKNKIKILKTKRKKIKLNILNSKN